MVSDEKHPHKLITGPHAMPYEVDLDMSFPEKGKAILHLSVKLIKTQEVVSRQDIPVKADAHGSDKLTEHWIRSWLRTLADSLNHR